MNTLTPHARRAPTLALLGLALLLPALAEAQNKPAAPPARPSSNKPPPAPPTSPPAARPSEPQLPPLERQATDCPERIRPGMRFKLQFRGEVDLKDLVTWASDVLCKPVLVPSSIRQQKVQIIAPSTTTLPEAYRIFLSALNSMGLTIKPEGNAFLVMETAHAKESPMPLVGPSGRVPGDSSYVTKVTRLEHVAVDDVMPVLQKLKSKNGDIVPYAPTGMLIITDISENIQRMEGILRLIDQPMGGEKIWVVKLRNTAAADVSAMLEKIFQPKAAGAAGAQPANRGKAAQAQSSEGPEEVSLILPEETNNLLIVVANERTYRRMLALVKRLEESAATPLEAGSDRIHVYPLSNASAEDLATTLSGLGIGVSGGAGGARAGAARNTRRAATPGAAPGAQTATAMFEGEVKVAADKATNSLVIVASGKDYYTLRDLIRALDVARRQVFIEATILEVSLDKTRKLGAAFHLGGTSTLGVSDQNSLIFGGSEPNSTTNSILFSPTALSGLAAGIRGPAIPGADTILGLPPGTSVPAFGVYLQALQNNNDVNVVSNPHILTTDNEKASIEVGQNVPFPGMLGGLPGLGTAAGTTAAAGLTLGYGTSVQRQDVALKLEITPHVNESDLVRLEIDNEISDIASENFNGLGPATNKRKIQTTVVVRDQQSVVLGGLIKDRISETVNKVPLLGDIPILGYLFKFKQKSVTKQNLLIVITPYIIKDPTDLRRIFERKVEERRAFLERFSSFKNEEVNFGEIDYSHKRGLLEEINRIAVDVTREATDLRNAAAQNQTQLIEGPVEPAPEQRGQGGGEDGTAPPRVYDVPPMPQDTGANE